MKYLITGGCGFIGSNYINHLFKNKKIKKIVNIDILYYCASIYNINKEIRQSDRYKFIKCDLNNYNNIVKIIKEEEITHIVHFAAQSHVDNSFDNSLQYTYDNVKGTHTLLEAIKNTNKNIIMLHFSTDEVYGETESNEMNEGSILCPTNPYSASKAAAEMYVHAYIYSYKLKIIISRGNNVFGYNQYPEKLIPKFIKLLREGKKCTIHGNGNTIRNFIFIDDVCTAVDYIINRGTFGEVYNIGSEHSYERSVLDVTKLLIKKIKNDDNYEEYIEMVKDRPFNDKRYLISNNKLKELGWVQKINFEQGINLLLEHTNNTQILLFKPYEENIEWNLFYNNLKKTIGYDIKIYSHDEDFRYIYNLIEYIKKNKSYKNFLLIDDYFYFHLNGLNKKIYNFDNIIFKNLCLKICNNNKLLDYEFNNKNINMMINNDKLQYLDLNYKELKNIKLNYLDYFLIIYNLL